jgi:drug/metabolite transporter (DMT)-like permease
MAFLLAGWRSASEGRCGILNTAGMNKPIIYALAAMVCYGFSDFIYKQAAAAGIRADHFLMAQGWLFCPLVIVYALATNTLVLVPAALWGSLAGAFVFIGFYCFIRSLAAGSVSTNAAIFRLNFIVTVLLVVVLLGEPLTPGKIAGLALALLATWLLLGAGALGERASDDAGRRSLVLVAVATLAFGTSNFFHTLGLRHGALPETLAVAQAILFMPLATAVVYVADRKLRPPAATFKYSAPAAVVLLAATISLLRSVAAGPASVLVPIAQMGFVVAALLGIFVLRERVTVRKVMGLVLGLAALAALAGS